MATIESVVLKSSQECVANVWVQPVVNCLAEAQLHVSPTRPLVFTSHPSMVPGKTLQGSLPVPLQQVADGNQWHTPDHQALRAEDKCWARGLNLWLGRDQFDVCAYGLAKISSTSVPAACRRSVLSVSLQVVGDQLT